MKQAVHSIVIVCLLISSAGAVMVPFVIPADIPENSQIAMDYEPLTPQDRLSATDHFVTETGERVRLWGVNLSFAANFPAKPDAERIAERLAAFGVNAVRCHHMDTSTWPRGIWDENGRDLHPEALDRLDYFIDQLARRGIYTNLNLHVGKKFSAVLDIPESEREYDKMTSLFTPALIDAQKDYARRLLRHTNPYRAMPYADDYAVAIVEITNENSLFMWGAETTLRTLPAYYADLLREQYNAWLQKKYGSSVKLERAWLQTSIPLGENMLKTPTLTNTDTNNRPWNLEQHADCRAKLHFTPYHGKQALYLDPTQTDGTGWHLQYNQGGLRLQKGRIYTVEFDAAAPQPRPLNAAVLQAHEPWQNLGLSQAMTLQAQWKRYRMNFAAGDKDDNARLTFLFGDSNRPFYLANVTFRPGVEYRLDPGESLDDGTVALFGENESEQRRLDRMMFLAETEKAYFDGMKAYLEDELGCRAMITGTIVFGPLGLYAQSEMDFIDGHAYWQHPRFPNRPWDTGDWLIDQKAMSDFPQEATLHRLAAQQLRGKPFTVTEYNHPAPLDAQAETVPMIASFAAARDWDGVWLYTYSHSNDQWDRERLNSFFDIDTNPAKWGFMPAGAELFRNAALQPLRPRPAAMTFAETMSYDRLQELAQQHLSSGGNLLKALEALPFRTMVSESGRFSVKADLLWNVVNDRGLYVVRNDRACVVTGQTERFAEIERPVKLRIDRPGFAAVTAVCLDEKPFASSRQILVTACGRVENTGMRFSEDRRTVGQNWGQAPVLIEPVEGRLTLPDDSGEYTCKVLNANGTVAQTLELTDGTVPFRSEYGTMWYLIERTPK